MPLATGQSLTFYEILGPLGAGGMGEVYRARDTRLEREVAIKVLPDELADDEERLRRFEREAKTLASLSHANVAHVYGIDQTPDTCFMAMELVPGEDLAERLARGPLPIDEALDVCRQIAEGLEAAHETGVVHRDLKPANVRMTPEGVVKVLDFGLAKPLVERTSGSSVTAKPDSYLVTAEGMVLGTPTYMSPEQARAKPVDRRTDIWAFGCVLFECLTGRRCFSGEGMADILGAIVATEPDWDLLPAATPPHVRTLLRRCLTKDVRTRLRDIGEARVALAGDLGDEPIEAPSARATARPWQLASALLAVLLLVVLFFPRDSADPASAAPVPSLHAQVPLPAAAGLAFGFSRLGVDSNLLALSPDGGLLVYVGRTPEGGSCLYRQDLTSFDPPERISGTEGAKHAFFSPDGGAVGFIADDRLKRISPAGDGLLTICQAKTVVRGQWTTGDTIYFAENQGRILRRVSAAGGDAETVIALQNTSFIEVLPGGRTALMLQYDGRISMDFADVVLLDLETLETRLLLENAYSAHVIGPGELLFARGGSLHAIAFDAERGEVSGKPETVLRDVVMDSTIGVAQFALSENGTLVFAQGPVLSRGGIAWVDRAGNEGFLPAPERTYGVLDLDPGDGRLAVQVADVENYVWSYDIADDRGRRLPGKRTGWPVWSSAGDELAYSEEGGAAVRIESVDGSRNHRSFPMEFSVSPGSWSPDDRVLTIHGGREGTSRIGFLDVGGEGGIDWVENDGEYDWGAAFSPDGKWIAYSSDALGYMEVWVRSYPDGAVELQLSDGGGIEPVWCPNGELFYRNGDRWMSVDVQTEPELTWSAPRLAFETDFVDTLGRSYDVTSDGQKLYVIKQRTPPDGSRIQVITNWR